ncbi:MULTISPECIES: hypothetical protein [unclassified Salinicola]|uniref:hypothetical protein n=1 Tax=unclassified Salinicola TaxID=2634022 RepID=UPI001A8D26A2|nr:MULTISPECIES: hypothetical protein [unclassified Salinicola]MCE3026388.1 hypothetical protein [Salinicola sp. DM10]WIX31590.1 hypothetical protein QO259_12260 [Salinicola sp. JS01]
MKERADFDYQALWQTALHGALSKHGLARSETNTQEPAYQEALREAFGFFLLTSYAASIRESRATPWCPLEGLDAARLVAMEKLHLHPHNARSMIEQDLLWALHPELCEFTLPEAARDTCRQTLDAAGLADCLAATSNA